MIDSDLGFHGNGLSGIGLGGNFDLFTGLLIVDGLDGDFNDRIVEVCRTGCAINALDAGLFDLVVLHSETFGDSNEVTQVCSSAEGTGITTVRCDVPGHNGTGSIDARCVMGAQVVHIAASALTGGNQIALNVDLIPFVLVAVVIAPATTPATAGVAAPAITPGCRLRGSCDHADAECQHQTHNQNSFHCLSHNFNLLFILGNRNTGGRAALAFALGP